MKDVKDSESVILRDIKHTKTSRTNFPIVKKEKVENRVVVSCQDIRNLVSTLYLSSLPGLEGIVTDYDVLIDEFYEPVKVTD